MSLKDTIITVSGSGIDPVTMTGEQFEEHMNSIHKTHNTMSDSIIPKTERRSLRYDFTAVETHDLSLRLAGKTKEFNTVTEEKKSVMSQYSAKLNGIKADCNKLSNQVSDGWEMREVECTIEFNKPKAGRKILTRSDNQQKIEEQMESWEYNLFTSVGADDGIEADKAWDNPKPAKKSRRKGKNSTDILDEVETIDSNTKKHYKDESIKNNLPIIGDDDLTEDDLFKNPDDISDIL